MSESSQQPSQIVGTLRYTWDVKKVKITLFFGPSDKRGTEFTTVAKILGPLAVHPSVKIDSDGKGLEYMKDSHSITALPCKLRITWARDECDAFKIAEYLATMFPIALGYRSIDKVMAGLPNWVAAWIKECKKAGSTKGGYVPPPDTTEDIRLLLEKYNYDRKRACQ